MGACGDTTKKEDAQVCQICETQYTNAAREATRARQTQTNESETQKGTRSKAQEWRLRWVHRLENVGSSHDGGVGSEVEMHGR